MEKCGICKIEFKIERKKGRKPKTCSKLCNIKLKRLKGKIRAKKWRLNHKGNYGWRRQRIKFYAQTTDICQKCNQKFPLFVFDIHHVDKSKKEGYTNRLTNKEIKILVELWKQGKIKVLCSNCHRLEHYNV